MPAGFSDPYCEVSMGSQEHRTKVIPQTLNPKWNSAVRCLVVCGIMVSTIAAEFLSLFRRAAPFSVHVSDCLSE